ncbi:MFS transporter [Micromonospora sp. NPDC049559]|uniref:MFS transporter n=1 Tax=Micromonospora sp. NPDC049559 TaxID=3155923 RepID=UPI00344ABF25
MQTVTATGRLGHRGLRLVLTATVSRLVDEAAGVAVVLVVMERTGDARLAGLVVSAFALPTLLTGPLLGALLDRLRSTRALFLANQVALAGALAGILLLAGRAPGPALVGLGLLAGLTAPVLTGGFSSVLPRVVPPAGMPRANAADAASYNVAGLGGPACVAALAASLGAGPALAGAAGLAAVGAALVLVAPLPAPASTPAAGPEPAPPAPTARPGGPAARPGGAAARPGGAAARPGAGEPLVRALADGLRLLWHRPRLRRTTIATTVGYAAQGLLPVAVPLLAVALGEPAARGGWLLTALSGGALVGALASERLLRRYRATRVLAGALAGAGLGFAAVAAAPTLAVSVPLAALAGIAGGPVLAATLAVRQEQTPPHRYAQLVATAASIKTGAYALGAAATGLLAAQLSPRGLLAVVAAGQALALVPLLWPAPRRRGSADTDRIADMAMVGTDLGRAPDRDYSF